MPETLYLDPELAARADALFRELGLDMSTAVQLFLRQSLREHGLPFTPRLTAPQHAAAEQAPPAEDTEKPQEKPSVPQETENDFRQKEEPDDLAEEKDDVAEEPATPAWQDEQPAGPSVTVQPPDDDRQEEVSPVPGGDELKQAFIRAHLIGVPLRRVRSLNRLYAIGEPNAHVKGWREVYVSGDEPFALDFGAVRVELGFHGGGSLRMMDGRLPDQVLEADAVYPRDLSAVFSSVIGQPLTDVSSSRVWDEGQERERLSLRFANGCSLTFAPGNDWGAQWLSDAHGSVMFAPDAVWLRVLDDRAWNGLR